MKGTKRQNSFADIKSQVCAVFSQLRQCWYFMYTASEALRLLFRETKHRQFQMMLWGKEGISLCRSPVLGISAWGLWTEQPNCAGIAEMLNCLWPLQCRKGKILFTKMSKFVNRVLVILQLYFYLGVGRKLHKSNICLIWNYYINIAIKQSDISIMITVLMFYRQIPRHSELAERMTPAEGHSEYSEK